MVLSAFFLHPQSFWVIILLKFSSIDLQLLKLFIHPFVYVSPNSNCICLLLFCKVKLVYVSPISICLSLLFVTDYWKITEGDRADRLHRHTDTHMYNFGNCKGFSAMANWTNLTGFAWFYDQKCPAWWQNKIVGMAIVQIRLELIFDMDNIRLCSMLIGFGMYKILV